MSERAVWTFGLPDTTPDVWMQAVMAQPGRRCEVAAPENPRHTNRWICSLPRGHGGDHVALPYHDPSNGELVRWSG